MRLIIGQMLHNSLYQLSRRQKLCLNILGVIFLVLTLIWIIFEIYGVRFPMEPVVVLCGGFATLGASYWPWKPTYRSQRTKGRKSFDYQNENNGQFVIGRQEGQFTLEFTRAGGESIHMYSDPKDIDSIALTSASCFAAVKDAGSFNFANRRVTPEEGSIVALRNVSGTFALVHIHDIKDSRTTDTRDEVTFSYVINPIGKVDFS